MTKNGMLRMTGIKTFRITGRKFAHDDKGRAMQW
jgi:hypothetical protein